MQKDSSLSWPGPMIWVLIALSLLLTLSKVCDNDIVFGQIGKQTFVAEYARSYARGQTQGFFPQRHFLEIYHPDVVPWAEEFPIYVGMVAFLHKFCALPVVVAGRVLSFTFFLLLLWGSYRWGKMLLSKSDSWQALLFPLVFAWFPLFRQYASSIMPDMAMTCFCLWAMYWGQCERWGRAAFCLLAAMLFKYYAFFTMLALGFSVLCDRRKSWQKRGKILMLLGLSALPTLFYLAYFLYQQIPNAITEYRQYYPQAHLGHLQDLLSLKWYSRVATWTLVKGPTVAGALLGLGGGLTLWRQRKFFIFYWYLALVLFAIIFSASYYVHDYYSLQMMLLFALGAAWALVTVTNTPVKWRRVAGGILFLALAIQSQLVFQSAQLKLTFYQKAANFLQSKTAPSEKGFLLSDRTGPTVFYLADRTGWTLSPLLWQEVPFFAQKAQDLLAGEKIQYVAVMLLGDTQEREQRWQQWRPLLGQWGWTEVLGQENYPSTHRKEPAAEVWMLKKK